MAATTGDFELTLDELRVVARYTISFAQDVLPVFEEATDGDLRPRAAIDAALKFAGGEPRTNLQRVASIDAHRAAKEAPDLASRLAAQAAGDAASAAYLHPLAKAHQVGHILRAAANAAHIAEIQSDGDSAAAERVISEACRRAKPLLIDVLVRYPVVPVGKSRSTQLMALLDAKLRKSR